MNQLANNKTYSLISEEESNIKKHLSANTEIIYSIDEFLEESDKGNVILTSGDSPQINLGIIKDMLGNHNKSNKKASVLLPKFKSKKIFANMCIVDLKYFKQLISSKQLANITMETLLKHIISDTKNLNIYSSPKLSNVNKVRSRADLISMMGIMKDNINATHIENGVIIMDPNNTYIEADVFIEYDTVIEPGCMFKAGTRIGKNCFIGHNSRIENTKIGNNVKIENSVVIDSHIKDNAVIGPYAYIRPDSVIGENVKIGDFVEIKNSTIGDHTKISHLTYVGDADVGKYVNFGCGSILVNYDGINKHRSTIEDNAFIGCNTKVVSPVTIGESAFTAAGSTITKDLPSESLGIARARQENKKDWVKDRNLKKE